MPKFYLLIRPDVPEGGDPLDRPKRGSIIEIRPEGADLQPNEKKTLCIRECTLTAAEAQTIEDSLGGFEGTDPTRLDYTVNVELDGTPLQGTDSIPLKNVPAGTEVGDGDELIIPGHNEDIPYVITEKAVATGGNMTVKLNTKLVADIEDPDMPAELVDVGAFATGMDTYLKQKKAFKRFNKMVPITTDTGLTVEQVRGLKDKNETVEPIAVNKDKIQDWIP